VIGGYIPGGRNFSEFLIGYEKREQLLFVKRLVAGFVPHTRERVFDAIRGLRTSRCPLLPEQRRSSRAVTAEVMRQCVGEPGASLRSRICCVDARWTP
jgi:hypothetical protein